MFINRRKGSTNNNNNGKGKTTPTPPTPEPEPLPSIPPVVIDPTADGLMTSQISTSDYRKKSREIMELYWALLDLHAGTVFDLPRVVVIGAQSSGKSSLVEAVTGICVPRDSNTCTRCPMDCTMTSNALTWSCTISLRIDYDKNGARLANPSILSFDRDIFDPALVELQIRRAQAAILSPHRPSSDFYNMTADALRENAKSDVAMLSFSRNAVQVEVRDPNATDLTFVDLPGLVQNLQDNLIKLVRELVEDYVRKKNTLIVITMPMNDDIQNMEAVKLAENPKIDPRRERTIGVVTKPDGLTQGSTGSRQAWKAIIEGRQVEHLMKHGYYCVRLPDDEGRKQIKTRIEAENLEKEFFANHTPWSEMDRSRFGIPNFVKDISELLIELIERNLPKLRKTVERELSHCRKDLEALPLAFDKDPTTEIMIRISSFCRDVKDTVFGQTHKYFVQLNKERYSEFKRDIEMTTPDFRPVEDSSSSTITLVTSHCQPRGLGDVSNVIKGSITWELTGHVPFEATKTLVLQYTNLWKDPSVQCFEGVVKMTTTLIDKLLVDHFGRFTELERYMRALAFKERDIHRDEARRVLDNFLRLESDPLYTQNSDALQAEKTKWLSNYGHHPYSPWFNYVSTPPRYFFPKTFPHIGNRSLSKEDEIDVMARVQAYFQIAHKRIIDYIPLTIEHELNQAFAATINQSLFEAIFKDAEAGQIDMSRLVRDDPAVELKRTELEDRLDRLLQIKDKLDKFQQSSSAKLGFPADEDSDIPEESHPRSRRPSIESPDDDTLSFDDRPTSFNEPGLLPPPSPKIPNLFRLAKFEDEKLDDGWGSSQPPSSGKKKKKVTSR